jgi:hypothetical protein
METILNLIWLAVTLAALCLWRLRWAGTRRKPGHNVRLEAVAMVCILALLFPVISLTDDLHPEVIPVDAASSKRALVLLAAQHAHGSQAGATLHQQFAFNIFRTASDSPEMQIAGCMPRARILLPLSCSAAPSGRAPPSFA